MRKFITALLLAAFIIPLQAQMWSRIMNKEMLNDVRAIGIEAPPIRGQWYWVDPVNGSANNSGTSREQAVTTVAIAYGKCTTGAGDGIILEGVDSSMVAVQAWAKNGITMIGASASAGYRQQAKMRNSMATAAAKQLAYIIGVTGNNCSFYNICFENIGDSVQAIGALYMTGNYNYFEDCSFSAAGASTPAGANASDINLSRAQYCKFVNCVAGNDRVERTPAAAVDSCAIVQFADSCRAVDFIDCFFKVKAESVTQAAIMTAAPTALDGSILFKGCTFAVQDNDTTALGGKTVLAFRKGAKPADESLIMLQNCGIFGWSAISAATNDRVFVDRPAANSAGGIATKP